MPAANYRDVRKYGGDSVTTERIACAARALKFKVREQTEDHLTLRVGFNFWSFGERISVAIEKLDSDSIVDITSTCRLPTQFIDYGKNKRNVRRLFAKIEETAGQSSPSTAGLICHKCGYLLVGISDGPCPECGNTSSPKTTGYQNSSMLRALRWFALVVSIEISLVLVLRFWVWAVLSHSRHRNY
jgi:hypothetical protein